MVSGKIVNSAKKKVEWLTFPAMKFIARAGIPPNVFTLVSFLCGLASVYFLFNNGLLFILFSIIAILFDIIDGNLARYIKKADRLGFYLDQGNDRIVNLLLILKYNIIFGAYWIALPIYILHYGIFFLFKTKNVIYVRSVLVVFFMLGVWKSVFYSIGIIASIALLITGITLQAVELARRNNINK